MNEPPSSLQRGEKRIPERRSGPWAAFGYRDFRLIWSGQLISSLGYWMQFTSLTYLFGVVLADTAGQSALNLGLLGASRSIPVLIFAPLAGYVADRYPRKRTLFLTNAAQAVGALALAFIAHAHGPLAIVFALIVSGTIAAAQSFDNPARQSWLSFLVPRQLMSNAIGLMSLAGNAPLMIGPAIAGILIATVGVYPSFFVQAASQWLVVLAIAFMKPSPLSDVAREPILDSVLAGVRFVAGDPVLRWSVLMLLVACVCLRPYTWLLAGFAAHVLHVDAKAYGLLLTMGGIGTIGGSLTTTMYQTERRAGLLFFSVLLGGTALLLLGFVHDFAWVLVLMVAAGWGIMLAQTSSQIMLQMFSPEHMRGRSMALYAIIAIGLTPAGTAVLGALGSAVSLPISYAVGGGVAIILGLAVWLTQPLFRRA